MTPAPAPTVVSRAGTYRTASPEQTRARVEPMLDLFGITRVADLTRLDEVGLPVHVAYRPCGKTLAVSIGIGLQPVQSWVGAAMESIEVWHAENPRLTVAERAPASALDLPYDVRSLNLAPYSPLTSSTVLDWVAGRGLLSGRPTLVPAGVIRLDATQRLSWDHALFDASSNGLATGNCAAEATMHGLLEVIERDCCAPFLTVPLADRRYVDPDTAGHPVARAVLAALRQAGCWVEVCETTNAIGIACYASAIWSADLPMFFTGFGAHLDPDLAMARAMSEAALSRLATISGARDDIDEAFYANADVAADPTGVRRRMHPIGRRSWEFEAIEPAIRHCAQRVAAVTGVEPFVVDLTHPDIGIPVSKVIAPGLRMLDDRAMPARPVERHG